MTCALCGRPCEMCIHVFTTAKRQWTVTAPLYFAGPVPARQDAVTPFCSAACSLAWTEGRTPHAPPR